MNIFKHHRITESSMLEETFKIFKSNSTIIITPNPYPEVPHPDALCTLPKTAIPPPPLATYSNA